MSRLGFYQDLGWQSGCAFEVHHNEASGYCTTSIPKPAIDHLGKGERIEAFTYTIKGSRVEVKGENEV